MRAVVYDRYGPPEVLRIAQVARPEPQADQVLVKVLSIEGNKIRLSRKALIREQREKQQHKKEASSSGAD